MRTYYRSPDIMVTSDHVVVLRPRPVNFRITELKDAYIVRHGSAPIRPQLEIRARYRSSDVRLFITTDSRTFGQVRRALIRALEQCKAARS
ncbi:DUF6232 family protein [Dactylosporangium sp. NPDC005555]|uniref:DUF6232 family protein n=1 Tax=Dactylosporangium sp. NPDC005555 TaxID=3154889 RepID=UPI0033BF3A55